MSLTSTNKKIIPLQQCTAEDFAMASRDSDAILFDSDFEELPSVQEPYIERWKDEPQMYNKFIEDPFTYCERVDSVCSMYSDCVIENTKYLQASLDVIEICKYLKVSKKLHLYPCCNPRLHFLIKENTSYYGLDVKFGKQNNFRVGVLSKEHEHIFEHLSDGVYVLQGYSLQEKDKAVLMLFSFDTETFLSFWHIDDVTYPIYSTEPVRESIFQRFLKRRQGYTKAEQVSLTSSAVSIFHTRGTDNIPICIDSNVQIDSIPADLAERWKTDDERFNLKLQYSTHELIVMAMSNIMRHKGMDGYYCSYKFLSPKYDPVHDKLKTIITTVNKTLLNGYIGNLEEEAKTSLYKNQFGETSPANSTALYQYFEKYIKGML